jgi:predicted aspartyl protease
VRFLICLAAALLTQSVASAAGAVGIRVQRDPDTLLFLMPVTIGSTTVSMIVDTGASQTILTPDDAARMRGLVETGSVTGAGITGTAVMRTVQVTDLTAAGRRLGVRTVVIGMGGIPYSLLGQAELRDLGPITIDGDVMTIGGLLPHGRAR